MQHRMSLDGTSARLTQFAALRHQGTRQKVNKGIESCLPDGLQKTLTCGRSDTAGDGDASSLDVTQRHFGHPDVIRSSETPTDTTRRQQGLVHRVDSRQPTCSRSGPSTTVGETVTQRHCRQVARFRPLDIIHTSETPVSTDNGQQGYRKFVRRPNTRKQ